VAERLAQPGRQEPTTLELAARVVAGSDREHPADGVLREVLRTARGVSPDKARRVSEAVFAYFRWQGWLDGETPLETQLRAALECRRAYAEAPGNFAEAELLSRAVPAWVQHHLEVTPAWVRSLQQEPVLWLRARPGQGRALAAELGECRAAGRGRLADALEYRGASDLFRTPAFQAGGFEIQDLHSQAVGWLCDPQPGATWWDACAGEGGKLLHLSDLMQNRGLIWASDVAEWRLRRLKLRARRAGVFNYRLVPWPGGERLPTRTTFDGVLVDAPCSNLGTWGRNPHARWTTTPEDVQELAALQTRLLMHAARAVKPGGRLVYAVCTLTAAETVARAAAFSEAHPAFRREPLADPLEADAASRPELFLRSEERRANGMYVAAWENSA
jgi:16S rRNA (cytosine967-C5)-methyltransferase